MNGGYGILEILALIMVVLSFMALSGCISPQDFVAEPGGSTLGTATPTSTSLPGEPSETGVTDIAPVFKAGTPQYFVKTPYGYLLTSPTTGIRLVIVEIKEEVDVTGQRFISGKIKNDENFRINHITVNFNLYNPNGNLIGNAYAGVNSLGPGKVWKFSTNSFSYKDYNYYEMAGIFTA